MKIPSQPLFTQKNASSDAAEYAADALGVKPGLSNKNTSASLKDLGSNLDLSGIVASQQVKPRFQSGNLSLR